MTDAEHARDLADWLEQTWRGAGLYQVYSEEIIAMLRRWPDQDRLAEAVRKAVAGFFGAAPTIRINDQHRFATDLTTAVLVGLRK